MKREADTLEVARMLLSPLCFCHEIALDEVSLLAIQSMY